MQFKIALPAISSKMQEPAARTRGKRRTFCRLGGIQSMEANSRLVSAIHRDLRQLLKKTFLLD
jgi:DNA-binding NtrC family response regulator